MTLAPLLSWDQILLRLQVIFPAGLPDRSLLIREMAAKTIYVALYIGAVEGNERWLAPRHIVRMGDRQAGETQDTNRDVYYDVMTGRNPPSPPDRWYAENSREPLRDEVIRQGLVPVNAMIERPGVPTTSPLGRYALQRDFADLFHPDLSVGLVKRMAEQWRGTNLSPAARARAALVRSSATTSNENVVVQCPNGPSIILPPGPSPMITKAVVEVFAPTFLGDPRVAWISDSARKQPFRNAPLEKALQIKLDAAEMLPDVVLVDLEPPGRPPGALIVFIEVVATDGPVTEQRRSALLDLIAESPRHYGPDDAAFVTAYDDRGAPAARRTIPSLAWRSFAWFVSEPDHIIQLHDGTTASRKLSALL